MNTLLNVLTGILCLIFCIVFAALGYFASESPIMIPIICVSVGAVGYIGTRLESGAVEHILTGCLTVLSVAIGYWVKSHSTPDASMVAIATCICFIVGTLQRNDETDPVFRRSTKSLK